MEKYQFGRIVGYWGYGGYAMAFSVTNTDTGEKLAMKRLRRDIIVINGLGKDLEREVMNYRVLQHPQVIEFKEVVLDSKLLGIVMEFADGGRLLDSLLFEKYDETKARKVFQQLIAGVSYIHYKRICHRDLEPNNILLNSAGDLKICDFCISKSFEMQSITPVGFGDYLAPEVQVLDYTTIEPGQSYDGKQADMWVCGVILYELLARILPDRNNLTQCVNSLHVSEECKDLLHRLLVEDPNSRITALEIVEHPWYKTDLHPDLTAEAQEAFRKNQNVTPSQAIEDIQEIIAQIPIPNETTSEAVEDIQEIIARIPIST